MLRDTTRWGGPALSSASHTRSNERMSVWLLLANGFSLMFAYYLLRPVREAFILAAGSAELRSYAVAITALVLMALIPLYSRGFRHRGKHWLIRCIMIVFIGCLLIFWALARLNISLGIVFFVWLGVFSVVAVAQFWATAADMYSVERGQRMFPTIALGVSLGAIAGSQAAAGLLGAIGADGLIIMAAVMLTITLFFSKRLEAYCRAANEPHGIVPFMSGYRVLARDRYLVLIALSVVLLNWINSTGDFILAKSVLAHADRVLTANLPATDRSEVIGIFYARFYTGVSFLGLFLQLFLVPRLMRHIGVRGSALVLPAIMIVGYSIIAIVPIFSVIQIANLLENSCN